MSKLGVHKPIDVRSELGLSGVARGTLSFDNATIDAIAADCLAWYPCNEGVGYRVRDLVSGAYLVPNAIGSLGWSTALPGSSGIAFDGTNYYDGTNAKSLSNAGYGFPDTAGAEFSINGWFRITDATPASSMSLFALGASASSNSSATISLQTGGTLRIFTAGSFRTTGVATLSDNTVYMITMVNRTVAATPTWFQYINAVEDVNATSGANTHQIVTNGPFIFLGQGVSAPAKSGAVIGQVSFWKRALSAAQITALYASGAGLLPQG